jgi:hypothetical protein
MELNEREQKRALPTGDDWKYRKLQFNGELGLFGPALSQLNDRDRAIYLDFDYLARRSPDGCSLRLTLPEPTDEELQLVADALNRRGRNLRTYRRAVQTFANASLMFGETIGKVTLPLLKKELTTFARFSAAGKIGNVAQKEKLEPKTQKPEEKRTTGQMTGRRNSRMTGPQDSYDSQDSKDLRNDDGTQCRDQSPADRPSASSAAVCADALSETEAEKIAKKIFEDVAPGDPRSEWKVNRTPLTKLVLDCGKDAVESAARIVVDKIREKERFTKGPFAYLTTEARRIVALPKESRAARNGPEAKQRRFVFRDEADAQRMVWAFQAGSDESNGEYKWARAELCKHTATLSPAQRDEIAQRIRDTDEGVFARRSYRFAVEKICEAVANKQ